MSSERQHEEAAAPGGRWILFRRILLGVSLLLSFGCCFGSGLFFGIMRGERFGYNRQYQQERELIEPILAKDPAFAAVEIHIRSNGGIFLSGEVPTTEDSARLRELVVRAVGEPRAKEILLAVHSRSGDIKSLR
jgi:hypothetical protein